MSCRIIYHPITGQEVKSKLWNQINSEVLDDKFSDELYSKTVSENFRLWFGNLYNQNESHSQVIDFELFEPLLLFHGSKNEFDRFALEKSKEIGFHFGTKQAAVERSYPGGLAQFGVSVDDAIANLKEEIPTFNVKPFFLNIRKMIEGVDYLEADPTVGDIVIPLEEYNSLYRQGREEFGEEFTKLVIAFYQKGNLDINQVNDIFDSGIKRKLQEYLGNPDGYWYINRLESKGEKSYVVFDTKNIKSLYNNGNYSQYTDLMIKSGVDSVFEQNPELANAVYSSLGFKNKTQIAQVKNNNLIITQYSDESFEVILDTKAVDEKTKQIETEYQEDLKLVDKIIKDFEDGKDAFNGPGNIQVIIRNASRKTYFDYSQNLKSFVYDDINGDEDFASGERKWSSLRLKVK